MAIRQLNIGIEASGLHITAKIMLNPLLFHLQRCAKEYILQNGLYFRNPIYEDDFCAKILSKEGELDD